MSAGRGNGTTGGSAGPGVSDHAVLRFLERAGGIDVEQLRDDLSRGLARAHHTAQQLGQTDYLVKVGHSTFVVRAGVVTTVLDTGHARQQAHAIGRGSQ